MSFDSSLKRYFPVALCGFIATAAYFQASGVGQLVGATIAAAPAAGLPNENTRNPTAKLSEKKGDEILKRNPFDSITGPLDGVAFEGGNFTPPPDGPAPIVAGKTAYDDPPCEAAYVTLITVSDDPAWSFASIMGNDGKNSLRRENDAVGSHKIVRIGYYPDAPDPAPRVWMQEGVKRCVLKLGEKKEVAAVKPGDDSARKPPAKKGAKVPDAIAQKIRKISETEWEFDRSVVDEVLEKQAELMKGTKLRPDKANGGVKLNGIKPDSLLGTLGLQNADQLLNINGFDMSNPEKALEAYQRLRTADKLTLSLKRNNQPLTIEYHVK